MVIIDKSLQNVKVVLKDFENSVEIKNDEPNNQVGARTYFTTVLSKIFYPEDVSAKSRLENIYDQPDT